MSYIRRKKILFLHPSLPFSDHELKVIRGLSSATILPLNQWTSDLQHTVSPIILTDYYSKDLALSTFQFSDEDSEEPVEVSLAITNAPQTLKTTELLNLGRVKAIFYRNQSLDEIALGLDALSKGQNWLSRDVSDQIIDYYRSIVIRHKPPYAVKLTRREMEVLKKMRNGLSNSQLAENLFLSEHTVKSHLYKIYRKLEIGNREAAVEWAHHFLN